MSNPFLSISRLDRQLANGETEHLDFEPGVNLLVGPPNTGKTKWLQTLDFLLGDDGQNPFDCAEETGLDKKYDAAGANIVIGEESFRIDRRWRKAGAKGKVLVDEQEMPARDFQHWLMKKLGIPVLHYPKGNPMSGQTWPELIFRSLLRHIHRQQRFWGDLAEKQYEGEQHACLLQFLGLAEILFSDDYAELVRLKMDSQRLRARRDQYGQTLEELTREVLSEPGLSVSVNAQSIRSAQDRVQADIEALQQKRVALLSDAQSNAVDKSEQSRVSTLGKRRADLVVRIDALEVELRKATDRLEGLRHDRIDLGSELERITRASDAGEVLSNLRITHCPACDQPVVQQDSASGGCFLCHQNLPPGDDSDQLGSVRIKFEQDRLTAELKEVGDLISILEREVKELTNNLARARDELGKVENELRPAREAVAALVQDEVSAIDRALGEASERQAQLSRVTRALAIENKMQDEIQQLEEQIEPIEERLGEAKRVIDFDAHAELLEDGINDYLNVINKLRPDVWRHDPVSINLSASGFKVRVGRRKWSAVLGGTDSLYFLMAYNYGLLSLSSNESCHYPGFSIIDVPGEFSGEEVRDKENFIVQPFIDLLAHEEYAGAQLIISGVSFSGLENVNRIRLDHVYAAK
jgi:predicted  nucleic acid-binding Zn-ribbon protein